MKKILSLLLALCLLAGCLPMAASAAPPEVSARSNNADPFSLQQELYFKGTHVATINLPQSWEGRVVTKTNDGFAPDYFPSITCYSRLCTEKREEKGNSYCGDGKLFTIEITSGDSWKNMPCKWLGSFQTGGARYEVILLRVTDYRFDSADPAIQAEGRFFSGEAGKYGHYQEVIDNIVFHTQGSETGDDDLTIPYELRTMTGEVILTMRFPKRWADVSVSYSNDYSAQLRYFDWQFKDPNQTCFFRIELSNLVDRQEGALGGVKLYPDRPSYTVLWDFGASSPYGADIPAILGSIEPNPALKWDWWFSGKGFADVPQSAYYYDAVNWAVDNGITTGTDKTHFSPNQSCTRAQAVTFLWRAAGEPEPAGTAASFKDVKAGSYYEKAVQWAVEQNITGGTGNGKFSPDARCARGQIVTFLYRYAN